MPTSPPHPQVVPRQPHPPTRVPTLPSYRWRASVKNLFRKKPSVAGQVWHLLSWARSGLTLTPSLGPVLPSQTLDKLSSQYSSTFRKQAPT